MPIRHIARRARALAVAGFAAAGLLHGAPVYAVALKFGFLELNHDVRYDEEKLYFRPMSRALGRPLAGAEVALRESRFVGQAVGAEFALERAQADDAKGLIEQIGKLNAAGVRFFLIDAPGAVVAQVSQAVRGRELLLFNISAADDALRQEQCQPNLLHTIPNHAMQADAMAQYLVSRKWRSVLMLEGPLADDKLVSAA
ncbi:MAG: amino acid ABC transporter substrate-binding protein, partial [Proteobacteria bacterium]|nr:amino acid ABC transporter substrate-binding protein [Pseudomonadota bacterium]